MFQFQWCCIPWERPITPLLQQVVCCKIFVMHFPPFLYYLINIKMSWQVMFPAFIQESELFLIEVKPATSFLVFLLRENKITYC